MKALILIASLIGLTATSSCNRCKCDNPAPQPENWTNRITELNNHNASKITVTQGAAGTLTYKEGNCMPIIDPKNTTCKEYPVKGAIRIYSYTKESDVTRDTDHNITSINTTLIATAATDNDGFYQLSLQPGSYSLIMEYNGKLYNFMGDGNSGLHPITITSNTVLKENAQINKAVY